MFSKAKKSPDSNRPRDLSPSRESTEPQSHQPKYRKRENKPGEKEKQRVIRKNNASPSPHRKHRTTKVENSKTSSKTNQSNGNSKKKSKKQNNNKKKSKSRLAYWFCMSANTDTTDKDSRAPIKKSKQATSKVPAVAERHDRRDVIEEPPVEILATKHSKHNANKRYSAPPSSDWTTVVTKAIVENPMERPRSRTPTSGVRYRFDGTLERPYVYPGGLTFQAGDKKRQDSNDYSSFQDTTMDDSCEQYDEFDVRQKFYLRYDHDLSDDTGRPRDRRYSMPVDMVAREPFNIHDIPHNENDNACNQNIYDTPYESDNDGRNTDKAVVEEDVSDKRNSYYSTPTQNSGCIYMWHSCEDLQDCELKYHSKEAANRICNYENEGECNNLNTYTERNTCYSPGHQHNTSAPTCPISTETERNNRERTRKMSLPTELSYDYLSTPRISNRENEKITNQNGSSENGFWDKDYIAHSPVDFSYPEQDRTMQTITPLSQEQTNQGDNPFKRNVSRSSCMPGNKRFFFPPPPCYTPPKEEMEAILPLMDKASRHCGSQTDLADDKDDFDMKDRDFSLKREETQLYQDSLKAQRSSTPLNSQQLVPHEVSTEEKSPEGKSNELLTTTNVNNSYLEHNSKNTHTLSNARSNTRQSALTSTPKHNRRFVDTNENLKTSTYPKPLPRKRINKKDSTSSSFSIPDSNTLQPVNIDSVDQTRESKTNATVTTKSHPVPKKRRSQMIEPEVYTHEDIENGLAKVNENTTQFASSEQGPNDNKNLSSSQNQNSHSTNDNIISTVQTKFSSLEPCPQIVSSEIRKRLNSSLGSSKDGGCSSSRKTRAFSPSVDNMVDVFRQMTYDSDNEDNCNADDEMSIYNEDINSFKSTSVQNLLRSRSIFDRSLAVTRKRRQRMRDRKCHSQLLSSYEIDQYDSSHGHRFDCSKVANQSNGRTTMRPPLLKQKNLSKHSYTDSGNDSDMVSPTDFRGCRPHDEIFQKWSKMEDRCDCTKSTLKKNSWEARLKLKHELRKARSIEHLYWAKEAEVQNKTSMETCV